MTWAEGVEGRSCALHTRWTWANVGRGAAASGAFYDAPDVSAGRGFDHSPQPASVQPRTRTRYSVPGASPVTTVFRAGDRCVRSSKSISSIVPDQVRQDRPFTQRGNVTVMKSTPSRWAGYRPSSRAYCT